MDIRLDDAYEIVERITDGFFAVDNHWNFTYVNAEAARLLGGRNDLKGKHMWSEFPEATMMEFHEQYHKAVNEQMPVAFDAYFYPLKTWFDVRAYPSSNGLTVYFRDITSKKKEATKKEQHYRSLFHENPDAVFSFDLNGNYLSVNPAMERLLGYSEEEYLHQSFVPLVFREELDKTVRHYNNAVGGETQRYQSKAIHKNGSIVDIDVTNMPIIVNDEVVGVYGIAKDITSTKQSENALKTKTQQLESFIENNTDAIVIFNREGKISQVNKAFEATFNWSRQELLGIGVWNLPCIPRKDIEMVKELVEETKKGNQVIGKETALFRKNREMLNIVLSISPIKNVSGNVDGCSVTLRDITEWKKSQEMLRNAEKLSVAGQLAAGIAHEIRNPMTAIKGFIQLMNAGMNSSAEYYRIISSEIERIEQILSELLILAKPQANKLEYKDVNVILTQVATLLKTEAILKNVEIMTEVPPTPIFIHCEENQIKQVFINYIKNAIEAMPKGGKLVIQIRMSDHEHINISFKDEGVGMTEETLSKLGQPFFTTKEKGTGLGYMVSRRIIGNHYGEVDIISELNKGTTIEVILPYRSESQ